MTAAYQELAKREKALATKLGHMSTISGQGAITSTLAQAGKIAVNKALATYGGNTLLEPAKDLRSIRTDQALIVAKQDDMRKAEMQAKAFIIDAIKRGYSYDATERSAVLVKESTGLKISVELSNAELDALESFPVHGLNAGEWSHKLAYLLSTDIDAILARPFDRVTPTNLIPGQLAQAAATHGERLGSIVREAFFAGTKAAMQAIREAMLGH